MNNKLLHKVSRIVYWVFHPSKLFLRMADHGHFKWIPDKPYLKIVYKLTFHESLDLNNPKGYNEKLNWIKLYDRKPFYQKLVDKIEVRQIVADKIGAQYLIPEILHCDTPEEINWQELPNQFALKCSHGSHCNIICTDKSKLDINKTIEQIRKWQKKSWFWFAREWPYKNLKPRILVEEYMEQQDRSVLTDYKIMCFDGEPKIIEVHKDRGLDSHTQDFYDCNWNNLHIRQTGVELSSGDEPPKQLEEMMRLSRILSEGMIHIRVDWYIIQDRLYFGELTFFDGAGFTNFIDKKDDLLLGSYIHIPKNR